MLFEHFLILPHVLQKPSFFLFYLCIHILGSMELPKLTDRKDISGALLILTRSIDRQKVSLFQCNVLGC